MTAQLKRTLSESASATLQRRMVISKTVPMLGYIVNRAL